MKFYKARRAENGFSLVAAEGEPWEKTGLTFMLEIPKDITDCEFYEMAGKCSRCIMRHDYPCQLALCRATEKRSGVFVAEARSKSALIRALNRLDYDKVKYAVAEFIRRNGIRQPEDVD